MQRKQENREHQDTNNKIEMQRNQEKWNIKTPIKFLSFIIIKLFSYTTASN